MSLFSMYIFSFSSHRTITEKTMFFLVSFLYRHQKAPSVSASASLLVTSSLSSLSLRWKKSGSLQDPGRPPYLCYFKFPLQISSKTFHCQKSFCPSFLPFFISSCQRKFAVTQCLFFLYSTASFIPKLTKFSYPNHTTDAEFRLSFRLWWLWHKFFFQKPCWMVISLMPFPLVSPSMIQMVLTMWTRNV